MWRGTVVSFLLPRLRDPAPRLNSFNPHPLSSTFLSSLKCWWFFLFLFLPHLFFVTMFAVSLTWTPPFPFILPLTGWNPAIFFHQLHKNLSRFPSSQLALIFSSFEPHCVLLYFLWHLTHSTSCYGCLILSMNCDLLEGKYNMLTSPDEVIVKLSSRFFYFPLDILLMSCIKRCI